MTSDCMATAALARRIALVVVGALLLTGCSSVAAPTEASRDQQVSPSSDRATSSSGSDGNVSLPNRPSEPRVSVSSSDETSSGGTAGDTLNANSDVTAQPSSSSTTTASPD